LTWLRSDFASQAGRGKLPTVVVATGGSCMGLPPKTLLQIYTEPCAQRQPFHEIGSVVASA
jgi:hypothetical protein